MLPTGLCTTVITPNVLWIHRPKTPKDTKHLLWLFTHIDKYKGLLRIYHGTMDDNVHCKNSLPQLVKKPQEKEKHLNLWYIQRTSWMAQPACTGCTQCQWKNKESLHCLFIKTTCWNQSNNQKELPKSDSFYQRDTENIENENKYI